MPLPSSIFIFNSFYMLFFSMLKSSQILPIGRGYLLLALFCACLKAAFARRDRSALVVTWATFSSGSISLAACLEASRPFKSLSAIATAAAAASARVPGSSRYGIISTSESGEFIPPNAPNNSFFSASCSIRPTAFRHIDNRWPPGILEREAKPK